MIGFEFCSHFSIGNALTCIARSKAFFNQDLLRLEGHNYSEEILASIEGRMCTLKKEGVSLWLAASLDHLGDLLDFAARPVYDGRTQTAFDAHALVNKIGIREVDAGHEHLREALDMRFSSDTSVHVEQVIYS